MSDVITDQTQVKKVSAEEIDAIFNIDGDIALLPNEKKPTVFSRTGPDTTFLDNPPAPEDIDDNPPADPPANPPVDPPAGGAPPVDPPADPPAPPVDPNIVLAPPSDDNPPTDDDDDDKNKGGRPAALIAAAKKLVEKGVLLPFDDGKKLDDYTSLDFEELIEANFKRKEGELQEQLPAQFFSNMPPEMQQAYKYIADGGQDLKSLFQAMGASQEIRALNIETEPGQAHAVRSYLQATQYGTPEEIEEEIVALQDRGDLEKKATQFKPKLDAMQQNMVNQRLAHQEGQNQARQEQSQKYMENVYNVLKVGKLNDLELDERTQNILYTGLVQLNYQSQNGKQTNLLGHLLEKYQWVEPNHELVAEVLWHLADPDGYRDKVRETGVAKATAETVRKLKTEQNTLSSSTSPADNDGGAARTNKRNAIPKPKKNFFARD